MGEGQEETDDFVPATFDQDVGEMKQRSSIDPLLAPWYFNRRTHTLHQQFHHIFNMRIQKVRLVLIFLQLHE